LLLLLLLLLLLQLLLSQFFLVCKISLHFHLLLWWLQLPATCGLFLDLVKLFAVMQLLTVLPLLLLTVLPLLLLLLLLLCLTPPAICIVMVLLHRRTLPCPTCAGHLGAWRVFLLLLLQLLLLLLGVLLVPLPSQAILPQMDLCVPHSPDSRLIGRSVPGRHNARDCQPSRGRHSSRHHLAHPGCRSSGIRQHRQHRQLSRSSSSSSSSGGGGGGGTA
jgi:uncharacterized membrane protein YgcG